MGVEAEARHRKLDRMHRYLGVDVGANRIHAVMLDDDAHVVDGRAYDSTELEDFVIWAAEGTVAAIDAPDRPSLGPLDAHAGMSPKFRSARCAEVGLGLAHKIWAPWATSVGPEFSGWMRVGFTLHSRLGERLHTIEVYPHAAFRLMSTGVLPKKSTVRGQRARVALLEEAGVEAGLLSMWSHDALDAAVSALVARDWHGGSARSATCGHDGSVMWLPASNQGRADPQRSGGRRPLG